MQRALILAPLVLSLAPAVFAAAVPAAAVSAAAVPAAAVPAAAVPAAAAPAPILTLPPARPIVRGPQGGAPSEVLLTNVVGAARSQVPGLPGVAFQPGAGTTHFDRVYGHPSGRWVLTALADLPAGEDECLLADGELVLREGDPAPWTGGAEDCGTLDRRCAINGRGDLVFATNTSASALDDYLPLRRAGAVPRWTHAAREGDPVPGLPFATLDDAIDSPLVLDDGRVGFAADGIDGVASTSEDEVLVLGDVVLLQEGISVPGGQAGGGQRPLENLDRGAFWASLDGSAWMVVGDLEGPTDVDDVVIVDGAVVLQEGVPVPGGGFAEPVAPGGVHGAFMDGGGRWFARGSNASSGADWVVVDGAVVARTGAPITPGASERWDDVGYGDGFAALAGNRLGDRVVIGVTDDPDPARNTVVVLNGEHVVAREGDPVDLDGDGVAADGLYIETFGTDDALLTDALDLLTVVTLRDAGGTRRGQALLRQRLDPGLGVVTCAGVANSTGTGAGLIALGSAAVTDGDLQLRAVDLPPSAPVVFLVSRSPGLVMQPGGSLGQLCLGGAVGRFLARGQFGPASPAGVAALAVDVAALPAGAGPGPSAPGDTLHFQAWYRDHLPAAPSTTNLTGALAVVLR